MLVGPDPGLAAARASRGTVSGARLRSSTRGHPPARRCRRPSPGAAEALQPGRQVAVAEELLVGPGDHRDALPDGGPQLAGRPGGARLVSCMPAGTPRRAQTFSAQRSGYCQELRNPRTSERWSWALNSRGCCGPEPAADAEDHNLGQGWPVTGSSRPRLASTPVIAWVSGWAPPSGRYSEAGRALRTAPGGGELSPSWPCGHERVLQVLVRSHDLHSRQSGRVPRSHATPPGDGDRPAPERLSRTKPSPSLPTRSGSRGGPVEGRGVRTRRVRTGTWGTRQPAGLVERQP